LRKIVIKYNLEEYFGIDVQMKVIDLEFFILSIQLDSPMLSWIFYYTIWNLKFKIPSKFDYKQSINLFGIRFVGVGLKYNTLDMLIFPNFFVA
jgi:hypothetical protein